MIAQQRKGKSGFPSLSLCVTCHMSSLSLLPFFSLLTSSFSRRALFLAYLITKLTVTQITASARWSSTCPPAAAVSASAQPLHLYCIYLNITTTRLAKGKLSERAANQGRIAFCRHPAVAALAQARCTCPRPRWPLSPSETQPGAYTTPYMIPIFPR